MDDHQKLIEEKNQEIHYLRNIQVVLIQKQSVVESSKKQHQVSLSYKQYNFACTRHGACILDICHKIFCSTCSP